MSKIKLMMLLASLGFVLSGCVKAQVIDSTGGIWEYRPEGDHKDITKSMKYLNENKTSLTDKLDLYATSGFDGDVAFVAKCTERDSNHQCQNVSIALMDTKGKILVDFGKYYYPELVTYNGYPAFLINIAPDEVYRLYPLQQGILPSDEAGAKSVIFADDRFLIEDNGLLGFIGRDGKLAIEPKYIAAQTFVDGRAMAVNENGVLGSLTPEGGFYPDPYVCMLPLNETYNLVNSGGTLLDFTKDKRVEPRTFYKASTYRAPEDDAFCIGGHWGVVDQEGKVLVPTEYRTVQLGEHFHVVTNDKGIHALLNPEGKKVTEFDYDEVRVLTDEKGMIISKYAVVRRFNKWGMIAADGSIMIPFEHEELGPESEGFVAFRRDRLWGFMDLEGKEVFAPLFSEVKHFLNGRAEAQLQGKTTYVYKDEYARSVWRERDKAGK